MVIAVKAISAAHKNMDNTIITRNDYKNKQQIPRQSGPVITNYNDVTLTETNTVSPSSPEIKKLWGALPTRLAMLLVPRSPDAYKLYLVVKGTK